MEKIKNIVVLCVYISLTVLICSFIPSLFPETPSATQAYSHMQEQLQKIAVSSSIDEAAMQAIISEEEFNSEIEGDTVYERVMNLLLDTNNFEYIYSEESLTQVAEQIQSIYEAEVSISKDTQRIEVVQQIRMISGVVLGLSIAIVALIIYMQRKRKKE